jgi:hypothetical protein
MTAPADLEKYLSQRYGATGIIVRDQAQGTGLREWSEKDTQALCQWLDDQSKAQNPTRISHNLVETADLMGVGVHTLQGWLRRTENHLPTSGMDDGSSSPTPPSSDGWRRRQTGTPWGHTSSSGRKSEENHIKRSAAPPGAGTAAVQK